MASASRLRSHAEHNVPYLSFCACRDIDAQWTYVLIDCMMAGSGGDYLVVLMLMCSPGTSWIIKKGPSQTIIYPSSLLARVVLWLRDRLIYWLIACWRGRVGIIWLWHCCWVLWSLPGSLKWKFKVTRVPLARVLGVGLDGQSSNTLWLCGCCAR